MTTVVPRASIGERVDDIRARLREHAPHVVDLDAVAVVDTQGRLVDDVSLGEPLLAEPATPLADLVGPPWPVTVTADAPVKEVAVRLIDARRLSVLVVDDGHRPIGRILADDVVDALVPTHGRFGFPRLH